MNNKLTGILGKYLSITFVFWIVFVLIRMYEASALTLSHASTQNLLLFEFRGLWFDTVTVILLSALSLLPYLGLNYIHERVSHTFLTLYYLLLIILYILLVKVFIIQLIPVDQVIFTYRFKDLLMAASSSTNENWTILLPVILLLILYGFLQKKVQTVKITKKMVYGYLALSIFLLPFYRIAYYEKHPGQFKNFVINNKLTFFVYNSLLYYDETTGTEQSIDVGKEARLYRELNPQWQFTNPDYPFLHKATKEDVLGPFFNLNKTKKPNIVFIIVESLSRSFMGSDSHYGNFTPFLDSLSQHSLYFPNFLSTAERTFNVLPSSLGSLPYSRNGFMDLGLKRKLPYHFTTLQLLKGQGYYTRFYLGGMPHFNNTNGFLNEQHIDYIVKNWDKKYILPNKDADNWSWGYHDGDMYAKSMEDLDKNPVKEERFDIYLTVSSHGPFIPPNKKKYEVLFEEQMNLLGFNENKKVDYRKDANKFESILYTDGALRNFLEQYKHRPGYQNTIFFIFGDHAMPELHGDLPSIEKYHIPLIIYSPMLKRSKRIEAVSSHLDLAPSLISMISNAYHLSFPEEVAWLGSGLDTSSQFKNSHSITFMHNNKKMVELINGNYFLSFDDVYEVKEGLETAVITNESKRKELKKQLENFIKLNYYTTLSDKVIPEYLYMKYASGMKTGDTLTIPDVETKNPIVLKKAILPGPYKIANSAKALLIENDFDFYLTDTLYYHKPIVMAELKNSSGKVVKEFPMDILEKNNAKRKPNTWNKSTCGVYIDLEPFKDRKDYTIELVIVNEHECPSFYRTWKFDLKEVK
jgi:phosphoglycerol transferase MdoB-like AlkP superfamily enzyme